VSKHDTHFFNVFSVVLGLLVVFAILMFALARYVGAHTQQVQVLQEPMLQKTVAARVGIPSRVAVAGQDNTALKIAPVTTSNTTEVAVVFKDGSEVYEGACKACHSLGIAGAPKAGDATAWGPTYFQG
jgi:cytochrome c5